MGQGKTQGGKIMLIDVDPVVLSGLRSRNLKYRILSAGATDSELVDLAIRESSALAYSSVIRAAMFYHNWISPAFWHTKIRFWYSGYQLRKTLNRLEKQHENH
jgi:hypothetical protein